MRWYVTFDQNYRDSIIAFIWFIIMVPLAILSFYFAHLYNMMEFTILGWVSATIGGIHLGWGLKNRKLYDFDIIRKISSKI